MKPVLSKPIDAGILSFSAIVFLSLIFGAHLAAAQQAAEPARGAARGRGGAGGVGTRGAAPLGDGPWDFGEGPNRMHVTIVTKGPDHPWGLAFVPGGDTLVTERPGRLRVIRKGVLDPMPVSGLPEIRAAVLGGLMDVVLHPRFAENHLIYFTYSKMSRYSESPMDFADATLVSLASELNVVDIFPWIGVALRPIEP